MNNNLHRAFQNACIQCPEHLASDIVRTIQLRRRRTLQIKLSSYAALTLASLAAVVPATIDLLSQLSQSGFYHYASLAFSDAGSMSGYWKQFGITILEAVPAVSVALVLAALLALAWSSRNLIRNTFALRTAHS